MSSNESEVVTFTARPYQQKFLEICKKKNTIVYLPTGSGKTYIASLVLQHFAKDIVKKPFGEGGKRSIFVVNTVVLAKQQAKYFNDTTPLLTRHYTGDLNVDNWKREKWRQEFEEVQLIVATCQIIVDVINHGYLSVEDINVLVFDECHHGRRDHPMHQLMSHFEGVPKSKRPRVVGLSGMLVSPGVKVENVEEELDSLENVFMATIATAQNLDDYQEIKQFSTKPVEKIIKFVILPDTPAVVRVEAMIAECIRCLNNFKMPREVTVSSKTLQPTGPTDVKKLIKLMNDFVYQMRDMGVYGASISVLSILIELEVFRLSAPYAAIKNAIRYCVTIAEEIRHYLVDKMEHVENEGEKVKFFASAKLRTLIALLEKISHTMDDPANKLKALVFVQRRYTSKCLYHILRRYAEATADCHIRPDFIVGCNNALAESIEAILQTKNNKKTLDKFKKNETNLICASSVLEEGIDLQMCNVVIAYDHPRTFTSYAQTKGRARMRESQYVIMIDDALSVNFLGKLSGYQKVEEKLQKCLVGKTIDRPAPLDDHIKAELFEHEIQPFYTPSGAKLTGVSAMNLLNRYATGMPRDKFTNSSILWEQQEGPMTAQGKRTIVVNLQLPIQSKINGTMVSSDPCQTIKGGKRSAAFKACKMLYYAKELNDNLLPITKDNLIMTIKPLYFQLWEKYPGDSKLAGTKKNKRIHEIVQPVQLVNCHPKAGGQAFLYIIHMEGKFNPIDYNQKVFEQLHSSSNEFGILTTKLLPTLAKMSFFVSLGCVEVRIDNEPKIVNVQDEVERKLLNNFHNMLFRDVLGIWKAFFCSKSDSYLIVPTCLGTGGPTINWSLVRQFQNLQKPRELNEMERRQMMASQGHVDYLHKVVNPWYRMEEKQYVVTKVHEELTPMSTFPHSSYETYAEYYLDKYGKRIMVPEQPMIEVKGISTYLNLLSPGAGEAGKLKRYSEWTNTELYIPELCHNYQFPADVWLKACILPSVLHRLHFMLLAEMLRFACVKHAKIQDHGAPKPIDSEKYVIDKLFKKNDSKTSFYISNYQAAVEDSDEDDEMVGHRTQNRSIVYPNPEQTNAKTIDGQLQSLCDAVQTMWNAEEEPIDLERHWDNIYPIEIQNYVQFLLRDFNDLNIADRDDSRLVAGRTGGASISRMKAPRTTGVIPAAICDDPRRMEIKLLSRDKSALRLEQNNFLKALTTATSGDVFDMERFEVLGDAFLKFIVSFYLILTHQDWHEGFLTTVKGQIVSNRNLYYCGLDFNLPGMIKVAKFAPKDDWLPPNLGVPQRVQRLLKKEKQSASLLFKLSLSDQEQTGQDISEQTFLKFEQQVMNQPKLSNRDTQMQVFLNEQSVADKTVADTMEALLGVCVDGLGIKKAATFLTLFKILPDTMDLSTILDQTLKSKRMRADIGNEEIDDLLINYQMLEQNLGYRFKDRAYLLQALTHASYPTNRITGCYQQLEFLGDAVLDFLISAYIFERCPDMDPGQLTDLRSALVNNVTLACICVRNRFHLHILAQNAQMAETISKFSQFQENRRHTITDQVDLLVTENDRNNNATMADYIDVPKVLGDVFESLIGAVFLDSGNDLNSCWTVIRRLLKDEIEAFVRNVPLQLIRRLFEFTGANPKFDDPVVDDDVVMVALRFTCRNEILKVTGFGQNKSDAQKAAAKVALQHLNAVV